MIMSLRRVLLQSSVRCYAKDVQARPVNEGLAAFTLRYESCTWRLAPGDRQPTFSDGRFSP
jgi:hypothetical protein